MSQGCVAVPRVRVTRADIRAEQTEEQRVADLEAIQVRGATVSDLTLDFTLPGFDLELKDGGKDIAVDIHNVEEYIELVLDWTLRRGVQAQINEFKKGFSTGALLLSLSCCSIR